MKLSSQSSDPVLLRGVQKTDHLVILEPNQSRTTAIIPRSDENNLRNSLEDQMNQMLTHFGLELLDHDILEEYILHLLGENSKSSFFVPDDETITEAVRRNPDVIGARSSLYAKRFNHLVEAAEMGHTILLFPEELVGRGFKLIDKERKNP